MRRAKPGVYETRKDAVHGLVPVVLAGASLWAVAFATVWAVLR